MINRLDNASNTVNAGQQSRSFLEVLIFGPRSVTQTNKKGEIETKNMYKHTHIYKTHGWKSMSQRFRQLFKIISCMLIYPSAIDLILTGSLIVDANSFSASALHTSGDRSNINRVTENELGLWDV